MKEIKFSQSIGNRYREVTISSVAGGGDVCHIYIDRYYYGIIQKIRGNWIMNLNPKGEAELTRADCKLLAKNTLDRDSKLC